MRSEAARPGARLLRSALLLIPLGVALNVGLSLASTDRTVLEGLAGLPRGPLVVAVGLAFVSWGTNTLRLRLWTAFLGHRLSVAECLRLYLAGLLGSALTPTAAGGGALKWGLLVRRGFPASGAASLLALETVEDALFFAVALPLAVAVGAFAEVGVVGEAAAAGGAGVTNAAVVAVGVAAAALCVVGAAGGVAARGGLGPRVRRWARRGLARARGAARRFAGEVRGVLALVAQRGKGVFAATLTLTAVQWSARYSVVTAVLAFLGVPARPLTYGALQWATFTLSSFVPTPGGAGGAEVAFAVLYSPFVPVGVLGSATALWRLVLFYVPLVAAVVVFYALGGWRAGARPAER